MKCALGAVFFEAWDCYRKQITDNLITKRLHRYSTEKLSTTATEDSNMEIEPETTADRRQIHDLIYKQTLEETKIFVRNYIALNTLLTR